MANLLAAASGNFTDASTWKLVDVTSFLDSQAGNTVLTTSYVESSSFTPGAITIDGIAVKLANRASSPSGTVSIRLAQGGATVSGTEVTINVSDLESAVTANTDGGWALFKFAAPVTLAGATTYTVSAKTSASSQVTLFRNATAGNWARMLRTTTTQAPAAGDDMHICGEKTGAGAETAITVTMNQTAATDYGSGSTDRTTCGFTVNDGGTLAYANAASTSYVLRLSTNMATYKGGTFTIGTVASPIPRTGTAKLQFDCVADGDFGFNGYGGDVVIQGLSRTSGKNIVRCRLNTDEAAGQTVLGVDTDTGWLSGDTIGIGSTSRTYSEAESRTLGADAGASSLTVSAGLTNSHLGTAPTQADVINLTRNVVIEAVSSTLVSYFMLDNTCTYDFDWAEFRYLGDSSVAVKQGLYLDSSGVGSINFCSIHDCEDHGLFMTIAVNNLDFSDNVCWALNTAQPTVSNPAVLLYGASPNNITMNRNTFMNIRGSNGFQAIRVNAPFPEFKDNWCSGLSSSTTTSYALALTAVGTTSVDMDISGTVVHSSGCRGVQIATNGVYTAPDNPLRVWRSNERGIYATSSGCDVAIVAFGNTTSNLVLDTCTGVVSSFEGYGDTTFSTTYNIVIANVASATMSNARLDIGKYTSAASGIFVAPATAEIQVPYALSPVKLTIGDSSFGASTVFSGVPTNLSRDSFIRIQKFDAVAGDHRDYQTFGTSQTDTTLYDVAAPSWRATPNSAAVPMKHALPPVAVNSGQAATYSIKVRESVAGDGTAFNGNRAKLYVEANHALGITADTLLDTATVASEGAWETLSGLTATVSDNGVLHFYLAVDGTAGWVNADSASVTLA